MKRKPLKIIKKSPKAPEVEKKVLFVEEWSTPKMPLKAFMHDAYEQKGEEVETVENEEVAPKEEEETFVLLDGPEAKIVADEDIPEDITIVTETETEEMKIVLDVRYLLIELKCTI